MRVHNNRKQTIGRKYFKRPVQEVIGFTVYASKINSDGKKTNNNFRKFIPVEDPKVKVNSKDTTKETKRKKLHAWWNKISEAEHQASVCAMEQTFECHVKEVTVNRDILVEN